MRSKRLSIKDKFKILKEVELKVSVKEVCHQHGISRQAFYNWRKKYESMKISDVIKLNALEKENRKLKRLLSEVSFNNQILKDILKNKKLLTSKDKKKTLTKLVYCLGLSHRHSRRTLNLNGTTSHDAPKSGADFPLKKADAKKCFQTQSVWQATDFPVS
jgi:putative transposase